MINEIEHSVSFIWKLSLFTTLIVGALLTGLFVILFNIGLNNAQIFILLVICGFSLLSGVVMLGTQGASYSIVSILRNTQT